MADIERRERLAREAHDFVWSGHGCKFDPTWCVYYKNCLSIADLILKKEREARLAEAMRDLQHEDTYEGSCGVHMPRLCGKCQRIAALERGEEG